MDFELTRFENDEKLLAQLEQIKSAENIKVLIPFAKAYLGMFYVIDKGLAEKDKVRLLASDKLSNAIFEGFLSSLELKNLPSIKEIGHHRAEKKEFAEGYVVLASIDLIVRNNLADIKKIDDDILEKAIAFYFSNQSGHTNLWFEYLLKEDKEKIIKVLSQYWVAMLNKQAKYLPGKNLIFGDQPDEEITKECVLPLLDNWKQCKAKTLYQLLYLGFKYAEQEKFLLVCEKALENDNELNEKTRLYWIASAYLLAPEKYFSKLTAYAGRVKLKIMPLLDFMSLILSEHKKINIIFTTKMVVQLLRMMAPIFPPQHHVYGAFGTLDINSKNIMQMFYHLAASSESDVVTELKSLRKARVMKIYSDVIDNLLDLKLEENTTNDFTLPRFEEYLDSLEKNECLHGRSNKFDIR